MIETKHIINGVMSQALETMAFLDIFPMDDDLPIPQSTMLSEISFTGPQKGTIEILAGLDLCRILAENIGALEDISDEDASDAVKELTNVVCGLMLPEIAISHADVFDMTVPALKTGDKVPPWKQFVSSENTNVINVEGYLVAIKAVIED